MSPEIVNEIIQVMTLSREDGKQADWLAVRADEAGDVSS